MKKVLTLLLCLILICAFAACGKSEISVPTGFQLASDPAVADYTLFMPVGWTVDRSTGMTSAYFNEADPSSISLVTFDAEDVNDPDDYWAQFTAQFADVFGDPENVEQSSVTLDGRDARQYLFSAKFGEKDYKFEQVVCLYRGRVYILTYASTAENYDKHTEDMRAVLLDGFKFGSAA